jgi:hypothetical protein
MYMKSNLLDLLKRVDLGRSIISFNSNPKIVSDLHDTIPDDPSKKISGIFDTLVPISSPAPKLSTYALHRLREQDISRRALPPTSTAVENGMYPNGCVHSRTPSSLRWASLVQHERLSFCYRLQQKGCPCGQRHDRFRASDRLTAGSGLSEATHVRSRDRKCLLSGLHPSLVKTRWYECPV